MEKIRVEWTAEERSRVGYHFRAVREREFGSEQDLIPARHNFSIAKDFFYAYEELVRAREKKIMEAEKSIASYTEQSKELQLELDTAKKVLNIENTEKNEKRVADLTSRVRQLDDTIQKAQADIANNQKEIDDLGTKKRNYEADAIRYLKCLAVNDRDEFHRTERSLFDIELDELIRKRAVPIDTVTYERVFHLFTQNPNREIYVFSDDELNSAADELSRFSWEDMYRYVFELSHYGILTDLRQPVRLSGRLFREIKAPVFAKISAIAFSDQYDFDGDFHLAIVPTRHSVAHPFYSQNNVTPPNDFAFFNESVLVLHEMFVGHFGHGAVLTENVHIYES